MSGQPHVAVTGAAGYIGSRVVTVLCERHPEWTVTALDNFYRGDVERIGDVVVRDVDIRDRERLEATLEGADVVVHLAAISGVDDCEEDSDLAYEVNVQGTDNVAWFCRKTGAALAFPFSMAVLGDPVDFPITVNHQRDPMNWYGRTKLLGERSIEAFAEEAFPAHQFMISNLYGHHEVGGRTISKDTVINFFVDRALSGETLTVYEPGTQARNFVHVKDVARVFADSVGVLLEATTEGRSGARSMAVGTDESTSVMALAEMVQDKGRTIGVDVDVELVENPRGNETLVEDFAVDASEARETLGWAPQESVESSIETLLERA